MKVIRKTGLLGLLVIATLFLQNVSATILLPVSSYAEAEGNWQGKSYHEKDGYNLRIDFAVYDTEAYPGDFTWAAELDMLETDRYIYAYQIFNRAGDYEEVSYFSILDIDGNPIVESLMHSTSSQDDERGGVAPEPSGTQGVWEYEGGILIANEHSWFLVFGSQYTPVAGSYDLTPKREPTPVPVPEIPEPGTIALLGIGGAMMISARRRRSAQRHTVCLHN